MGILREILSPVVWILKVVIFLVLLVGIGKSLVKEQKVVPNLVQIELKGAILDEKKILNEILQIKKDDNIKGVLFLIDSPGGAIAPSFEIANAIKSLKEKKPVVVYASGLMASGGYLSGVWASKINSNIGSLIGSIGVIMQSFEIENLMQKVGIKEQVVRAGEFKEAGTFARPWSEEERQSLQNLVNSGYEIFTDEVAKARNLDLNNTNIWANARIFSAKDALKVGLIDEISTYEKSLKDVENLSKVQKPIWKEKPFYDKFLDDFSNQTASQILSFFQVKFR